MLTFYILIMIVLGGLGSISGSLIGAALFAILVEWLRNLEEPFKLFGVIQTNGLPKGSRILVISAIFVAIMIFWQRGIMGRNEITWDNLYRWFSRLRRGEKNG